MFVWLYNNPYQHIHWHRLSPRTFFYSTLILFTDVVNAEAGLNNNPARLKILQIIREGYDARSGRMPWAQCVYALQIHAEICATRIIEWRVWSIVGIGVWRLSE